MNNLRCTPHVMITLPRGRRNVVRSEWKRAENESMERERPKDGGNFCRARAI